MMTRKSAAMRTPGRILPASLLIVLCVLILFAARGARGSVEFRAGEDSVVAADEVVLADLYIAGESVTIEGSVLGDVVAAGGHVVVRGSIEGDLTAAGREVEVLGRVRDDVRLAGRVLRLGPEARIGDHLAAAGFSFESEEGSRVQGTQVFAGFQALLAGRVAGDLRAAVNRLKLVGSVGGDSRLRVGDKEAPPMFTRWMRSTVPLPEVPAGLQLAEGAEVGGDLIYTSSSEAAVDPSALILGDTEWSRASSEEGERGWIRRMLEVLGSFAALFLIGLLLLWQAPAWLDGRAEAVRSRPLPCLGRGTLGLLSLAAAAVAVGLLTGLLLFLFGILHLGRLLQAALLLGLAAELVLVAASFVAVAFLAPTIAAYAGGGWASGQLGLSGLAGRLAVLAAGLLIFVGLTTIPYVGGVIWLLAVLMGLGALALWSLGAWRARREELTITREN